MNLPNIMIIGLAGCSGAGKSTVCGVFAERGFTVIDCDKSARAVSETPAFLNELDSRFPERLLNQDGTLNRRLTANVIFADDSLRELYNRIIFPYIIYDIIRKVKIADGDVLLDAPTLFEAKLDVVCTHIVGVTADFEFCSERIRLRDNLTENQARMRLKSQNSAEFFKEHSDYLIENNGTKEQLVQSAIYVIDKLKGGK